MRKCSSIPATLCRPILGILVASWLFALPIGCRQRAADFVPELSVSRTALESALNAWKAGLPAGEIADAKPAIYVTDTNRKPGQLLTSFEILGETAGKSGRTFAVTLELSNPDETLRTEYVIVGIDPIWVFRREDLELLLHWDHHMPASIEEPAASEE